MMPIEEIKVLKKLDEEKKVLQVSQKRKENGQKKGQFLEKVKEKDKDRKKEDI